MASVVNGFKGDGSDNDRIAAWLYDAKNEYNCDKCPYERALIARHFALRAV